MWKRSGSILFDDEFPFFNLVTTKPLGNMRDKSVRSQYLSGFGFKQDDIITAQQVHGDKVAVIKNKSECEVLGVDGLLTNISGVGLCIFTADCVPVLLGCSEKKAVGVIHAGWRGLAGGILEQGVNKFCLEYNAKPGDIYASIGPCIGPCCFEVSAEVAKSFNLKEEKTNLDLSGIACGKLENIGVKRISQSGNCTKHETDLFFSYRRDKTTERIMTFVAIK